MEHKLSIENVSPTKTFTVEGNRVVNLQYVLDWAMNLQLHHLSECTLGKMKLIDEKRNGMGLVSSLLFQCDVCKKVVTHFTDEIHNHKSVINVGAVWGTLSTGNTYTHLEELFACLDIPVMSYRTFHSIEQELSEHWKNSLWESIEAAGKLEYQLAVEKGQVDEHGNAFTSVFVDGGWSHRSYGHNYNAASGVAVIIGKLSKKILYLGIRNKYCSICARAANKNIPCKEHNCYKNWSGSSGAMESDILVEGFRSSIAAHKLKYTTVIGDGDSSVYMKLKQNVEYGHQLSKVECKNHAIKCYGKSLYNMKKDTRIKAEGRKLLTNENIKKLQNIVHKMLFVNNEESSLKTDLINSVNHVFENHQNCKEKYCSNVGDVKNSTMVKLEQTGILNHLMSALERLIKISNRLVDNLTNNCAELFMSILCKYNAGKRLNLTQRGSFQDRSNIAALHYNLGVSWYTQPWKKAVLRSPGKNCKRYLKKRANAHASAAKRKLESAFTSCSTKKVKTGADKEEHEYGPSTTNYFTEKEFHQEKERVLTSLKVTKEGILTIEQNTRGQWGNPTYETERCNRLTASIFGEVVKRKNSTSCHNLVKKILYPTSFYSTATAYGKQMETAARKKFAELHPDMHISEAGLFVHEETGYLGASPDGIVSDNGLLEIKCLHAVHKSGKSLMEYLQNKPLCVELQNNKIKLKRTHSYYYQVQGQLNICKKDVCFFIIYINDQQPLYIEQIYKDEQFWKEQMLPKLKLFYNNCILTELVQRNVPKGLKCIEPQYIVDAQEKK